jgi:hypothetical protein
MNGDDLFGLMAALGWLIDLPSFAPRADHLSHLITSAILTSRSGNDVKKAKRHQSKLIDRGTAPG